MDNFEKLTSPSLKDLFVSRIAGLILSGKLRVGEKFPPERTLAEQMGVGCADLTNAKIDDVIKTIE